MVVPLTLLSIVLLLYMNTRSGPKTLARPARRTLLGARGGLGGVPVRLPDEHCRVGRAAGTAGCRCGDGRLHAVVPGRCPDRASRANRMTNPGDLLRGYSRRRLTAGTTQVHDDSDDDRRTAADHVVRWAGGGGDAADCSADDRWDSDVVPARAARLPCPVPRVEVAGTTQSFGNDDRYGGSRIIAARLCPLRRIAASSQTVAAVPSFRLANLSFCSSRSLSARRPAGSSHVPVGETESFATSLISLQPSTRPSAGSARRASRLH